MESIFLWYLHVWYSRNICEMLLYNQQLWANIRCLDFSPRGKIIVKQDYWLCHPVPIDGVDYPASLLCSGVYGAHLKHCNDVTMGAMASQITSLTIVYSTIYSRRRSNEISKLRVTGLCEGNSPVTGEFPAQRANNAESVFIWWHHHGSDLSGCEIWLPDLQTKFIDFI